MKDFFTHIFKEVEPHIEKFPWENKEAYCNYLAQSYYYVQFSTRFLAAAAALFGDDREELHVRYLKHSAEERSHHLLAQNDLRNMGYELKDFPEIPTTAFMYQTQYFQIFYKSPAAFLGYILALEGGAAIKAPYMNERARKAWGPKASTFLHVHSKEDLVHVEKAFKIIEPLSQKEKTQIQVNLTQSVEALKYFIDGIRIASEKSQLKNAS